MADPGTFDWGLNFGSERTVELFFVANYFSQTQSGVSQSVNASAFGAGYTALLEEASRSQEGTQNNYIFYYPWNLL